MNLRRITFLRHGQADKTLPDHRLHPLSDEGKRQAAERRVSLDNPVFDLVIHSPLIRTWETAQIVAGVSDRSKTLEFPILFPDDGDDCVKIMNQAFLKLGHASLRDYYTLEEIPGVEQAIKDWALAAKEELVPVIRHLDAYNMLIVGHGILLQALCRDFVGNEYAKLLLDCVVGECEGFCVTTKHDGTVTLDQIR